jgi:uncharacterized membrane protein
MYLLVKLLHIAAVIAFLGNIATGLFWHAHAARTRDPVLLGYVLGGIIRSDRIFTVPGVIAIVATGIAAAILGDIPIPQFNPAHSTTPAIARGQFAGSFGAAWRCLHR